MNKTASVTETATNEDAKGNFRSHFAQHLEQQSKSTQTIHRWMIPLQAASLGIIVAIFVKALIVSIRWTQVNTLEIPFWWITFAASMLPLALFAGLDAIILRAISPTNILSGVSGRVKTDKQQLVTGRRAVLSGLFTILAATAWAAVNVAFAYSILTLDMNMLEIVVRIFANLVGVVAAVHFIQILFRRISRSTL